MSPFAFDTLSASKQLREAGMSEGVAEAVVSVFQHAAAMPDISHLATKADLEALRLMTKSDLDARSAAMKADLDALRLMTKSDLEAQSAAMRADIDAQGARMKADLDAQGARVKADLDLMRADIGALKREMATKADLADLRAEFGARLLQQTWMTIGGVTALVTMVNITLKIFD
jgi:predicted DNA-binding protein (UPF0251 family)